MPEGTKADELALELEQAIVRGELAPGQVLRQEELSERYGVSRTPVREALRRLAALGLVSFEPNRGVRVRTLSRDELREAFLVRAELGVAGHRAGGAEHGAGRDRGADGRGGALRRDHDADARHVAPARGAGAR